MCKIITQEEKQLLLVDLCARLPYDVIVDIKYNKEHGSSDRLRICSEGSLMLNTDLIGLCIEEEIHLKPYLRPMESMTDEEREKYYYLNDNPVVGIDYERLHVSLLDWLNAHHFDYRGLIKKDLALEAPEGMYN